MIAAQLISPDSGLWSLLRGPLLVVLVAAALSPWLFAVIRSIEWDDRSEDERRLLFVADPDDWPTEDADREALANGDAYIHPVTGRLVWNEDPE